MGQVYENACIDCASGAAKGDEIGLAACGRPFYTLESKLYAIDNESGFASCGERPVGRIFVAMN